MSLLDIFRRSARSLLSAKTRTILTAFAIAVGAFALTLTLGASNGAKDYADVIVQDNFDPSELIVTNDDSLFEAADASKPKVYDQNFGSVTSAGGLARQVRMLSDDDISRLRVIPGVAAVRPAVSLSLQYITRDGQKQYVATAQQYDGYTQPELLAGSLTDGLTPGDMILPEGFVPALGFSSPSDAVGKQIRLSVRKQVDQAGLLQSLLQSGSPATAATTGSAATETSMEMTFTVAAVTKTPSTLIQPGSALFLTLNEADLTRLNDYATAGTANYHKYLTAYAKVADGTDGGKLAAAQTTIKKLGYGAQSVLDTEKIINQVISVLQGIVTVFGLIAVIASVFGIVNTMYISVLQRTREIGLMKALGMRERSINLLFLLEAGLIGFLGGLLGAATAVIAGTLLNPTISSQLDLGDISLLQFRLSQIVGLLLGLVFVAVLAGLLPARKAAKLDPIEALRTE